MTSTRPKRPKDLREACIVTAMRVIETSGLEKLSLREVARRLGVSHQAPYKHFPSRDHILAEIVRRIFDDFAHYLDKNSRAPSEDPHAALEAMGRAYLAYAERNPLQYSLMFETPLPDARQHPEMMASAQHAFALLQDCVSRMPLDARAELDALFVWSAMHGLASLRRTQAFDGLALPQAIQRSAVHHTLLRIHGALKPAGERSAAHTK
jgi:AcrR family transcriptional regulator